VHVAFSPHAVNIPKSQYVNTAFCAGDGWGCAGYCDADRVADVGMTPSLDMGVICGRISFTINKNRIYKKDKQNVFSRNRRIHVQNYG